MLLANGQVVTYVYISLGVGLGGGGGNLGLGQVYNVNTASDYAGPFIDISGGIAGGGSLSSWPGGAASYTAGATTKGISGSVQWFFKTSEITPRRK